MKVKILALLLLATVPLVSVAADAPQKIMWAAPAQYVDNTPILATAVITYNLYAKLPCTAAETKIRSNFAQLSTSINAPIGQLNCFTVTATVDGGAESDRSPEASGKVNGPKAKAVSVITIQ